MTVLDDLVADLDAISDRAELIAFLAPSKAPNDPADSERAPARWFARQADLEKRLGRQLTPADSAGMRHPKQTQEQTYANRAYGT
jgi:hypothetical protein